jgi:hypothetical protein
MIEAVPRLLGYHPHNSLLLIALHGERHRFGVNIRLDLHQVRDHRAQVRHAVGVLDRERADKAMVLIFTDEPALHGRPEQRLFDLVAEELTGSGIKVREALCVHAGRWWSYVCDNEECCPRQGTPIVSATQPGGPSRVAAEAAVEGLVALPSREALAATLRPVGFLARASMDSALDRVGDELAERVLQAGDVDACREELRRIREETLPLVRELQARFADPEDARMTDDEAARVLVVLEDVLFRDACIELVTMERGDAAVALWTQLLRRADPADAAAPATVLAFAAWQNGDGTLANIAVDRALVCDPDYRLANYLHSALLHVINPSSLRECIMGSAST